MASSRLRRALFERLFVNLAVALGIFQVLVWHWWCVVVRGEEGPSAGTALAAVCVLAFANGRAVPALRRHRRRDDWWGRFARLYMNVGISTLLLGIAVASMWILFLVPAGLLGAFGANPDLAFGVFRATSGAVVGSVGLLLLWGFTWGQMRVARTHLRVSLPGLAPELEGLRVVQISDLHIGNYLEGGRLERMVERVNAEDPDVTVLTGDIFDFDPSFVEEGVRILAGLRARYGVYAILGNHDVYTGTEKIVEAFGRLAPDLVLLRDEIVRLPVPAPLYLAGSEDTGKDWSARGVEFEGLEKLAKERPDDGPTLLLVHRPEAFGHAARLGFPVILAGHTHGGQMALPTRGGEYNLARIVTPMTRGVYREGESLLYVNRGLGVGGPALRINCPREIATIELTP